MKSAMNIRLSAVCVGAALLGGCATAPLLGPKQVALNEGPPSQLAETPSAPPTSYAYWVAGDWRWKNERFVWEPGLWVLPRDDAVYVQGIWSREGNLWVGTPAHWEFKFNPSPTVVTSRDAPPTQLAEPIPRSPGPDFVWLAGHWRPDGDHPTWEAGRWEQAHDREVWLSAHWVRHYSLWRYVPGRWDSNSEYFVATSADGVGLTP